MKRCQNTIDSKCENIGNLSHHGCARGQQNKSRSGSEVSCVSWDMASGTNQGMGAAAVLPIMCRYLSNSFSASGVGTLRSYCPKPTYLKE